LTFNIFLYTHERSAIAEIQLRKPHVISSESQSNTHKQEISFDTLLKAALRHRPDRIILGEIRGPEARTLLDAMNTGHDGTLTTIHASSAEGALRRIAALAVRSAGQLTIRDADEEVRSSIDVVVQLARDNGRRIVKEAVSRV
jgi:pilus assembly protein CpaF